MTSERKAARSPRAATKLLALVIALVAAGVMAEGMVRLARPGYPGFRLPQVEHRTSPGLGFDMAPGQHAYTWASPARINSLGFRGPEPRNPRGRPLVFCVGDSMTFGNNVEEDQTYAAQLQRMMAREWPEMAPETINMGVQRYFTYQEIEVIRQYAPRLRPDVVTLAVYINDLGVRPTGDFVKEYEDEREQAASAFRNVFPTVYLLLKNSAAAELARRVYLASGDRSVTTGQRALQGRISPGDERKWRTVEEDLVTFRQLAETHGFQPYVVFVPVRRQVHEEMPHSLYPQRLVKHARRQGLVAIDPLDAFKRELEAGRDPYLAWDDHMSPTGHRLVAEALLGQIRQHDTWRSQVAAEQVTDTLQRRTLAGEN